MSLAAETHKLNPSAKMDLFTVDLNSIGVAETYNFYPGTDTDSAPIVYQGVTYTPWYIKVTGIDHRGTGASVRPEAEIGNALHLITDLCRQYQDMVGAQVRRRRTLASYVIADIAQYQDEYYLIERRSKETLETVTFELASPMDFLDKQLPGMVALASGCPHRYKSVENGSGCSWPGTNAALWFDKQGTPVGSIGLDNCGKRLSDCKLRFGANNPVDYGGNPGLGRSSQ